MKIISAAVIALTALASTAPLAQAAEWDHHHRNWHHNHEVVVIEHHRHHDWHPMHHRHWHPAPHHRHYY